jgi:dipeptidyl aminopeptidase/acylaminoacyl peptidase
MKKYIWLICILTVACSHTKKTAPPQEKPLSQFGLEGFSQPDYSIAKKEDESMKLSRDVYESCYNTSAQWSYKFYSLTYQSDGLNIRAVVGLPPDFSTLKKHPLVVFNRAGNRGMAMLHACSFRMLQSFAETVPGAVVVASQYRGSVGSEGRDEVGGADVNDVINLVRWAESTGFVDLQQKYMIGWSRGGMMTYLTLKQHPGVFRAAAVIAGYTDLIYQDKNRKNLRKTLSELVPDYKTNKIASLQSRSVAFWPEKIADPILIVHGTKDTRVRYSESKKLVERLEKLGRRAKLVTYRGSDHSLNKDYSGAVLQMRKWFTEHGQATLPAQTVTPQK